MENELDVIDTTNDTETTENLTENPSVEANNDSDELKKKIATLEAQKEHWRKKASEKPEFKQPENVAMSKSSNEISTKDLYALMEARVPQEDISEVQEYAQLKGISISEALKATVVKSILNEKAEQRTVASATNVGATKRGSGKVSDETLISKAAKGELPDNDEDMIRLIKARKGLK